MEIKAIGEMLGLFSSTRFSKGDLVLTIEGKILSTPTRTTIQVGPSLHVDVNIPAKFINHSCDPNCEIKNKQLIAAKEILPGDEITFDYQKNEDQLAHPFLCKDCGKWIEGKKIRNLMLQVP